MNIEGFENFDIDSFVNRMTSDSSEAEVVDCSDEPEKCLPSVKESLNVPAYVKNFRGLLNKFIAREDSYLEMGEIKIANEVNFIVECVGLKALYESSLEFSNYENKAYVYAGRVIWKKYNLASLSREKKVRIAFLINRTLEHAYYNTYYA